MAMGVVDGGRGCGVAFPGSGTVVPRLRSRGVGLPSRRLTRHQRSSGMARRSIIVSAEGEGRTDPGNGPVGEGAGGSEADPLGRQTLLQRDVPDQIADGLVETQLATRPGPRRKCVRERNTTSVPPRRSVLISSKISSTRHRAP